MDQEVGKPFVSVIWRLHLPPSGRHTDFKFTFSSGGSHKLLTRLLDKGGGGTILRGGWIHIVVTCCCPSGDPMNSSSSQSAAPPFTQTHFYSLAGTSWQPPFSSRLLFPRQVWWGSAWGLGAHRGSWSGLQGVQGRPTSFTNCCRVFVGLLLHVETNVSTTDEAPRLWTFNLKCQQEVLIWLLSVPIWFYYKHVV